VLTLGYSRKFVRFLVFRSSTRVWAELHEKAFRRLGGATRVLVLDNLREAVLTPDIYDPALNPLYRDVLYSSTCVRGETYLIRRRLEERAKQATLSHALLMALLRNFPHRSGRASFGPARPRGNLK